MGAPQINKVSEAVDSYVVVTGNSFDINHKLKQYGFRFNYDQKYWYRGILEDKFWFWQHTVEGMSKTVSCCFVRKLEQVPEIKQMLREVEREMAPVVPHAMDGAIFEVSKWYANVFKENNNTSIAYRNLKVLKVKAESAKAYQVDAEFFGGIASCCGVCGLSLSNDISRATGIGPICATKLGFPRPTMETAKEIVAQMESLSKAQGVFKDVWIPKSQIKNIIEKADK
jgi:hypothetical protein